MQPQIPQLQADLLSPDEQLQQAALAQITLLSDIKALEMLRPALIIFSQLHLDADLKEKAAAILVEKYPYLDLQQLSLDFAIFETISTCLPWSGVDYTDLQRRNYATFAKIKSEYDNLLSSFAVYAEFYLDLGRKLYMLFRLEREAQQIFETILRYNSQSDEAHYSLARILEKQGNSEQALSHYQSCIQLNNKHLYALLQAGDLQITLHQAYQTAIDLYNKAIEVEPYSADIYGKLANGHYQLGEYGQAQQYAEVAISINEHHEFSLELLGTMAWRVHKDVEKALEFYQKGLDHQLHGDSALLLGAMAELHTESLQDYQKGRLYYQKSLRSQPLQPARLRKYIILLTEHFQDTAAAVEAYETYLNLAPNDTTIQADYQQFKIKFLHEQPQNPQGEYVSPPINEDLDVVLNNLSFVDEDEDDDEVEADSASDSE